MGVSSDELFTLLNERGFSARRLRDLLRRLDEAAEVNPGSRITRRLQRTVEREMGRLLYGVRMTPRLIWEDNNIFLAPGVYYEGRDGEVFASPKEGTRPIPIYQRPRMWDLVDVEGGRVKYTDDPVCFVDVKLRPQWEETTLRRLTYLMKRKGWIFLGIKPRGQRRFQTAVFLKGKSLQAAVKNAFGKEIADLLVSTGHMKYVQNMALMLCRQGQKASVEMEIPLHEVEVVEDDLYDGVMFALDKAASDLLRQAFYPFLDEKTTAIAGTLFSPWAKGVALLDQPRNQVFTATVKMGTWGRVLDTSRLLIHETDSAHNAGITMAKAEIVRGEAHTMANLDRVVKVRMERYTRFSIAQEIPYIYRDEAEQQKILNEIMLPAIRKAGDLKDPAQAQGIRALLYLGLKIEEQQTRKLLASWASSALTSPLIPGIFRLVVPDAKLGDFEIKVPKDVGLEVGDKVAVTRFPILAVGNATQTFTVVGFTSGNYVAVSRHPWCTVQGGDFDGDCARVSKFLHDLFPDKVYDQTPVKAIRCRTAPIPGALDDKARIHQALNVFSRAIGIPDLAARRANDLGLLSKSAALAFSRAVQREVDAAKHSVEKVDLPNLAPVVDEMGERIIYPTDVMRNPMKNYHAWGVCKGTIYEPALLEALKIVRQPLGTKSVSRDKLQELAKKVPEKSLLRKEDIKELISIGFSIAKRAQNAFRILARANVRDAEFERIADKILLEVEAVAAEAAEFVRSRGDRKLWAKRYREARMVLLRCIAAKTNLRLLARMVPLEVLEELLSGAFVDLTRVCEDAQR